MNKEIIAQGSRLKLDQLIYGSGTNWREWYEKLPHLCVSAYGKAANWVKTGAHTYPLPDTVVKWTTRGLTAAAANAKVIESYTAVDAAIAKYDDVEGRIFSELFLAPCKMGKNKLEAQPTYNTIIAEMSGIKLLALIKSVYSNQGVSGTAEQRAQFGRNKFAAIRMTDFQTVIEWAKLFKFEVEARTLSGNAILTDKEQAQEFLDKLAPKFREHILDVRTKEMDALYGENGLSLAKVIAITMHYEETHFANLSESIPQMKGNTAAFRTEEKLDKHPCGLDRVSNEEWARMTTAQKKPYKKCKECGCYGHFKDECSKAEEPTPPTRKKNFKKKAVEQKKSERFKKTIKFKTRKGTKMAFRTESEDPSSEEDDQDDQSENEEEELRKNLKSGVILLSDLVKEMKANKGNDKYKSSKKSMFTLTAKAIQT